MKSILTIATTLLTLAAVHPASASSSPWFDMEGASIRLVTAGKPDTEGRLRGMLEIRLEPGWKTYWRDPGDAGVPPTIDVSANPDISAAWFDFPAPQRHEESDFQWAGYDYPVALPITFTLKESAASARIDADIFLGVCETICVPVQARLSVDPAHDPENAGESAAVEAAFQALPAAASSDFGVKVADKSETTAVLRAIFAGDSDSAELFIAGEDGYVFSTPIRKERAGETFFSVEVTRPDATPTGPGLHYTLVTDQGSVSGLLPYF